MAQSAAHTDAEMCSSYVDGSGDMQPPYVQQHDRNDHATHRDIYDDSYLKLLLAQPAMTTPNDAEDMHAQCDESDNDILPMHPSEPYEHGHEIDSSGEEAPSSWTTRSSPSTTTSPTTTRATPTWR